MSGFFINCGGLWWKIFCVRSKRDGIVNLEYVSVHDYYTVGDLPLTHLRFC